MIFRCKKYPLLPVLALAFCPVALLAGEKLDPTSHAARVTHAMQLFQQGKYHEAEDEFRTLLDEDEKKQGLDHTDTLQVRKNLAIVFGVDGKFLEAETVLRDGIDLESGVLGPENKDVLEFRELLATTIAREGRITEAVRDFRELLAIRERTCQPGDVAIARARNNLGNVLFDQKKYAEAAELLRAAQPGLEKGLAATDSTILLNHMNLAKCLRGLGRFEEAEKEQRVIIKSLQQFFAGDPEVDLAKLNLAETLLTERKFAEALEVARNAESHLTEMLGADSLKAREAHQVVRKIANAQSEPAVK